MQKTVRKKTCKIMSCKNHAKTMSKSCQNHVMQTCKNHANMQKPCKTMQKPCNMRRVRWRLHCEKTCKLFVSCKKPAVPHAMKKTARKTVRKNVQAVRVMQKTSCSTCHAKTMQTCKNHATCGAYAGVYAGRRGTAAWRVRYSTYSTYSKDAGESGGSAAWLQCRASGATGIEHKWHLC